MKNIPKTEYRAGLLTFFAFVLITVIYVIKHLPR